MLKRIVISLVDYLTFPFNRCYEKYRSIKLKSSLGFCGKNVTFSKPDYIISPKKIFIYDNSNIYDNSKFIISYRNDGGRFIMKKNSGAAQGLTVVTGNHGRKIGISYKDLVQLNTHEKDIDVIVEEDVWLASNVTLLAGVIVGRGATVGSGSVVRNNVPPYAIVLGNPAKVVGFNFTPEEIIEHEKTLYPEEERLPLELLEKNYNKYFLKRLKEIKEYTRL